MNNYREFLENNYASSLAKTESKEYYNGFTEKNLDFYNNDKELMNKHHRFIKYMYSTFPKYIIQRNIIIYYYQSISCSISVLNKSVAISRTSLKKIINDSLAEGWVYTKIDDSNKRKILVLPTKLRIKFWLLYCKNRFQNEKEADLDKARNSLREYDAFENKKEFYNEKNAIKNIHSKKAKL